MSEQHPLELSPSARRAALLVARITYYAGILLGTMFAAVTYSVFFSNFGGFTESGDKWTAGAGMALFSIVSYFFAKVAHSKIEKLK